MELTLHRVLSIREKEIHRLKTGTHTKDIIIQTEKGEFTLSLFANEIEFLTVSKE